jgi:hypothetical protein
VVPIATGATRQVIEMTHPGGPENPSQSHAERFDLEFKPFAPLDETHNFTLRST